jgi:hypothetical protein
MKLDGEGNVLVGEKVITDLDAASSNMGDMAVDSNDNVHIVWSDVRDTGPIPNLELYYEKLDSSGNTLVDETRITTAAYYSHYPSLAIDSFDNLHIAYCEEIDVGTLQEEIHYIKLDNNGNILVDDTAVTAADSEESLFPDIAVDSLDNIHIVWLDDRNETGTTQCQDYYYSKLDGTGNTLVDDTMIFKNGDHFQPSIAVDSDDMIQMVISNRWFLATNEKKHMYYMKLDGNGDPVVSEKRLSISDENASHAVLFLDSEDNLNMVWEDERDGYPEIYYMKLDEMGNILHDELRLTQNQYNSTFPAIALNGTDGKHVVWSDDRDFTYWYSELYYKRALEEYVNKAPTAEITTPIEGQTLSGTAMIEGAAADVDGTVLLVEIKIHDGNWIAVQGTTSWTHQWNTTLVANGPYTIYARSFDGTHYSYEDMKNISVNNIPPNEPPIVTINPFGGDVSGTVKVNGSASDSDGFVQNVQLKIDGGSWFSASGTAAWSYSWDTTQEEDGDHIITARSLDDSGDFSQQRTIAVSVSNWVNTPPLIGITSPSGPTVAGEITVGGWASDVDGEDTILGVQVRIGSTWEDAQGISDWSYTWDMTGLEDGDYTIDARAYDGYDYSVVSSLSVHVDNPHAPSLVITSDFPEKVSDTITIQGSAADTDGDIETVAIQIDDGEWKVFSESTQWSYELDTNKLSNGQHTIRIRVTDDEGESDLEAFIIDVENSTSFPYWALIIGFIVLAIMMILIGMKMRKKPEATGQYQ